MNLNKSINRNLILTFLNHPVMKTGKKSTIIYIIILLYAWHEAYYD